MITWADLPAERADACRAARSAGSRAPLTRARAWLDLARVHLACGRLHAAAAWLRRAAALPPAPCTAFAATCMRAAVHYELHHGSVQGECLVRSELSIPDGPTPWLTSWQLAALPAGLDDAARRWCLPHWALLSRCRLQDRRSQVMAGWAVGSEGQAQALALQLLRGAADELDALHDAPPHAVAVAFEVARLAWTGRLDAVAERAIEAALDVAPQPLRPAVVAAGQQARLDAALAPLSTCAAWNLHLRPSEREGNELGRTIERREFLARGAGGVAQLHRLPAPPPGLPADAAASLAAARAMRRAHGHALQGQPAQALRWCTRAVHASGGTADGRVALQALALRTVARLLGGDVRGAQAEGERLIARLRRSGSASWALGCSLLLSRWGRHALVRRGDLAGASAAFALAHRLAAAFELATLQAQSLVDLASADEAIGFRDLACARYRVALATWLAACDPAAARQRPNLNRVLFVLQRSALGYAYQNDAEATALVCGDMRRFIDAWAPAAAAQPDLVGWPALAEDRLAFVRVLECLAALLAARRAGDDAAVAAAQRRAEDCMRALAPGDRAYWALQFARERNDLAAAREAAQAWETHGLLGGPLREIEKFLERAPGELARDELHLHRVETCITALKSLVSTRDYARAATHLQQLQQLEGPTWYDNWAQHRLLGRLDSARIALASGALPEAARLCGELLDMYEALEAQLTDDVQLMSLAAEPGVADVYSLAATVAYQAGDEQASFALAERGRARAMKQLLAHATSRRIRRMAVHAVGASERYASLRHATAPHATKGWPADQLLVQGVAAARPRTLPFGEPAWPRAHQRREEASAASVAVHCPPGTVVLAYSMVEDLCLSWSLTPAGALRTRRIRVENRQLAHLVAQVLRSCRLNEPLGTAPAELALLLLQPHADVIAQAAQLVVVPYGDLFRLPFQMLPFGAPGHVLGTTHAVSYLPAAALLARRTAEGRAPAAPPLVIGRPDKAGDPMDRELAHVARQLGCRAVHSAGLSRAVVLRRLAQARLVHVAAHGSVDPLQPWNSGLHLLRPGEAPITAAEIGAQGPRAGLVTLGACSSGVPGRARSDLSGFSRALLASGVGTCVVSLWDVDNELTESLMRTFYAGVAAGQAPAVALAAAQRALRGDAAAGAGPGHGRRAVAPGGRRAPPVDLLHPYAWAGFVANGPGAFDAWPSA